MNEKECNTNTYVIQNKNENKDGDKVLLLGTYKKDKLVSLRVSSQAWSKIREQAKKLGMSANAYMNLVIESLALNKSFVRIDQGNANININMPLMQQTMQTNIREWITETELNRWLDIAERQLSQDGKVYPKIREKIIKMACRLKSARPEVLEKIKKLTEFDTHA